jgi:drug/metabolite transporter (DMT)-like permease
MALAGLFGIVLYFLFENTGLVYTSASNASMISAAVPVFTLLTEALFFKLKITWRMTGYIILSIIGVYLVISVSGKLDFSSKTLYGNLLEVGAMGVWVVYVIINKALSNRYPGVIITAVQSFASIFLFIPFIAPEIRQWHPISLTALLNLLYLGIFCSACAYFFYLFATKRLGAAAASAFINLIPVVSVIFGYLVLGEWITTVQVTGMLLVLGSLFWMNRKQVG